TIRRPPGTPPTRCTWTRACWWKRRRTRPDAPHPAFGHLLPAQRGEGKRGSPPRSAGRRKKGIAMKYFHLIWAALFRRKTRTFLTLASILAAFLLFGLLDGIRTTFDQLGRNADGAQRLQTSSRLSFMDSLPLSLQSRIEKVDNIEAVT